MTLIWICELITKCQLQDHKLKYFPTENLGHLLGSRMKICCVKNCLFIFDLIIGPCIVERGKFQYYSEMFSKAGFQMLLKIFSLLISFDDSATFLCINGKFIVCLSEPCCKKDAIILIWKKKEISLKACLWLEYRFVTDQRWPPRFCECWHRCWYWGIEAFRKMLLCPIFRLSLHRFNNT